MTYFHFLSACFRSERPFTSSLSSRRSRFAQPGVLDSFAGWRETFCDDGHTVCLKIFVKVDESYAYTFTSLAMRPKSSKRQGRGLFLKPSDAAASPLLDR